jgi:hypothetical protein
MTLTKDDLKEINEIVKEIVRETEYNLREEILDNRKEINP